MLDYPLQLTPEYRDYVWGGSRLRPGIVPTAEAWVVYEHNRIAAGPPQGLTLGEAARQQGANLLGRRAVQQTAERFPLLIKLLDCAQWLSLQVHPDDEQALALEGPGFFGKTEAWHVLEADPGAQLIAGLKAGTPPDVLAASIRQGTILDWVQYLSVQAGDTLLVRPGVVHALGPGLLVYEVQQTSDVTYRVYDWGRPQTPQRRLHIEKALAVVRPDVATAVCPLPPLVDGEPRLLCQSAYFSLEILSARERCVELNTQGESFHALTVIAGEAELRLKGGFCRLKRFASAIVPAAAGPYEIAPQAGFRALKASV